MEAKSSLKTRSAALGGHPGRPVPIGTAVKVPTERGYGVELAILEILRGQAADGWLRDQGIVPEAFADGHEALPVRIRLGYYCKAKGMSRQKNEYSIGSDNFQPASADGAFRYEPPELTRQPEPGLIGITLPVGETREGWVVVSVPRSEKQPLLAFQRDYAHSNYVLMHASQPVWFKLYSPDPMQLDSTCAECRV